MKAQREAMERKRKGSQDGSQREGSHGGFTDLRTEDQRMTFPDIPLPFGDAYYKALQEQRSHE